MFGFVLDNLPRTPQPPNEQAGTKMLVHRVGRTGSGRLYSHKSQSLDSTSRAVWDIRLLPREGQGQWAQSLLESETWVCRMLRPELRSSAMPVKELALIHECGAS